MLDKVTLGEIKDLSAELRIELAPASRLELALASLMSLEIEDRAALVDMLKHSRAFTAPAPSGQVAA